ncbi:MAG TPA: STAS domain-containing protein [Rhodanobacteraceae bacterium]|jgi:anti-anti-sigma factor|nr:STAS domain-containing protein [Rhodanobacteraceae bacterium]
MALICDSDPDGERITLHISDRFDFSVHRGFHEACLARPRARSYLVDLEGVTSMDSSALGMLLLLREHAGGDDADIRILNAGRDLRNTFRVAGLDRLVTLG